MLIQIGIAAFVLIFFISGAHATDNGQWKGYQLTPYQQNWFSTVTVPKSDLICCTIADGYPVTAEPRGNHFWINYKGHWYQVPDAVVIRDHINPIGVPLLGHIGRELRGFYSIYLLKHSACGSGKGT
jgi:hypothetical protein